MESQVIAEYTGESALKQLNKSSALIIHAFFV